MSEVMIANMFELVTVLAKKQAFKGPEWTVYNKGLSFVERFYELQSVILDDQLRILNESDTTENEDFRENSRTQSY